MRGLSSSKKKKYNKHFKSFIGAQLQPGDNYLISIDLQNNSPHFSLEAAFHEIYAHAYAEEALGIIDTKKNPNTQHFFLGGSKNGRFDNMPNNKTGPPFIPYPIDEFYQSDIMFFEQGGVSIGNFIPDLFRMNSLIFGEKFGGATKIESTPCPCINPKTFEVND